MNLVIKIKKIIFAVVLLVFAGCPVGAFASAPDALSIYKQAKAGNYRFLNLVAQHGQMIDVQNTFNDTAYCIALKYNDTYALENLRKYGADTNHECVKRIEQGWGRAQQNTTSHSLKSGASSSYGSASTAAVGSGNSSYLWWGLGALAVGGGAAALAGGGGGGGSSSGTVTKDDPSKDDNGGGNNGGSNDDDNGGNNGDDNGGSDGDDNGGNNGDDNGDDNGGNDNPGGSSSDGGNSGMTSLSASSFRTSEYNKGNFLNAIRAAEAYSIIYQKNGAGDLVSHQASEDDKLMTVKVGIIDTGIYAHKEFDDKIVGAEDMNAYNSYGNIWGYANGDKQYFVYYKDGKYYLMSADLNASPVHIEKFSKLGESELNAKLSQIGLTFGDLTVMNDGDNGNPGVALSALNSAIKNIDKGADWVTPFWGIVNDLSHGTHVAGIIAAQKNNRGMHGVAFENAQIYSASWDYSRSIFDEVKDMVANGVTVFNNSWSYDDATALNPNWFVNHNSKEVLNAYAWAAESNAVWVQATGNEGWLEPGVQAGIPKLDLSDYGYSGPKTQYEVPFIAVTALDSSTATTSAPFGRIASYANKCGSTKEYCIAAPGTNITSTIAVKDGYMSMDGTSMATPVVSGAIALLNGYYPYLTAQNVAWLLLRTANDSGAYSDKDLYGRGVLDLYAAMTTPIGDLSLPTNSSFHSMNSAAMANLAVGSGVGINASAIIPKSVIAFDELNRPFAYNTSKMMSKTHGSSAALRNEVSRAAVMSGKPKIIEDEKTGFQFATTDAMNRGGKANLATIDVTHKTEDGATRFYYAENSKYLDSDDVLKPVMNPYFAMNDAYGAESSTQINDVSKLKFSVQTGENGLYDRDYERDRHDFDERAYAVGAEYGFNLTDYLELSALGGMLHEEEAMLGMNGRGGFEMSDGTTYYAGLKAALNLTNNFSLLAAYYRGYTQDRESAMLSLSGVETESFMLDGEYRFDKQNKMGLSLSSPLSVVKGKASFAYATGRDKYSDTIYMEKMTTDLKPATREYDLGLYYQSQQQDDFGLMGKLGVRFNADGERGVTDYMGIVGISKSF